LKYIYAQLIDDTSGRTIVGVSDRSKGLNLEADKKGKVGRAFATGQLLASKAKEQGISSVVFDRAGYRFHGRVKAVADGARKGGMEF
jgi:large subunit ribosomal protein L18